MSGYPAFDDDAVDFSSDHWEPERAPTSRSDARRQTGTHRAASPQDSLEAVAARMSRFTGQRSGASQPRMDDTDNPGRRAQHDLDSQYADDPGYGSPQNQRSRHEEEDALAMRIGRSRANHAPTPNVSVLNETLAAMDRRHRASQNRTETALANISQWIDVNEERREFDRKSFESVARKLDSVHVAVADVSGAAASQTRATFATLAERLESMEERLQPRQNTSADPGLRIALARLENRMDTMMVQAQPQPDFAQALSAFDRKIDALNQKIARPTPPLEQQPASPSARPAPQVRATGRAAMIELARRRRELDEGLSATPLNAQASADPHSSLDHRLEAIAARLDTITAHPAPTLDTAPLAAEMQRLTARINDIAGQSRAAPDIAPVGAELARLSARIDEMAAYPAATPAPSSQGREIAEIAVRLEALVAAEARRETAQSALSASLSTLPEHQAQMTAQLRGDIMGLSRALDALPNRQIIAGLEDGLRKISERIATTRGAGGADELLRPMEQMARDLQGVVRDMDPRDALEGLRAEIRTVSARMHEISGQRPDPQSLSVISAQVADLRSVVDGVAASRFPAERLEQQILALGERLDKIAAQTAAPAFGRAPKPDISGLAADIRGMVDRAMPTQLLGSLDQRLKELDARIADAASASPNGAPSAALADRIDKMQASLEQRIAEKPAALFDQAPITALTDRIDRMQAALESPRDAAFDLAPFEGLLREISQKIDSPRAPDQEGPSLAAIEGLLRDLSQKVSEPGPATHASTDLAPHLADIADRLARSDQGLNHFGEATQSQFARLSDRIDEVQSAVSRQRQADVPAANPAQDAALSSIVSTMETLSQRIDAVRAASLTPETFETMLERLVEKMDAARGPAPSNADLKALEQQIDKIAVEVQKSSATGATLSHLEQTVGDLLAQIENGHFASHAEAQAAAHTAAQEALRHALLQRTQAEDPESMQEIAQLRRLQQDSDQRTTSTLHILHDTLERIVDRLASLETKAPVAMPAAPLLQMPEAAPRKTEPEPAALPLNVAPAVKRASAVNEIFADDADFLIEPGTSGTARRASAVNFDPAVKAISETEAHASEPESMGPATTKQDFIAAARRSAKAAALESASSAMRPTRAPQPNATNSGSARAAVLASYIQTRRKPLLLMASALLLLFGALRILPNLVGHPAATNTAITAPITADPAPPAGRVVAPSKPMGPSDAGSPAPIADPAKPRKSASLGIDPLPTGSIASGAAMATMVMPQHFPKQVSDAALVRLATSGNTAAEYTLGMHIMGGTDSHYQLSDAARFIQKAASKGLVPAEFQLATIYEKGIGVKKDLTKAQHLYATAASAGNIRAMYNLGVMIAGGVDGKPDYATAAVWFKHAADHGVRDSQFNLAILYARGLGVPHDMVKAWAWFDIAAKTGDQGAAKNRDKLARHMNSTDLDLAKAQAAAFRVKPSFPKINQVTDPVSGTTGT